ncbi:MAG TPA: ABC transporter permease [Gemmatimonadaceae bacterium]|nr:ABC transporter permease [Gemmatimonadaceae bacterium]
MTWFHAARARLRLLAPRAAKSRIDDEIRFHIDMETQRLVREQKLDNDEARRRALATFGGVQQHRETLREGRGTAWFSGLSLDLKLGVRMLVKYPGLTIIGGLAMAFGIWFGAVTIQMFGVLASTKLPLPNGDRIVKIQNYDVKESQEEDRVLYDYQLWRTARSITDIGAYSDKSVNLVSTVSSAAPVVAAEITASAFRIAPARPVLGRVLNESDERAGAPPVVVLGHEVWTRRFDSDPQIIGRSVQLGTGFATVVGVMPEGYAFPESHEMWLPLRTDVVGVEPRQGPPIVVFGRLPSGTTLENARAELTTLGQRLAAEHPATHGQIQTHVIHYTQFNVTNTDTLQVMALTYFFVIALVVVVCSTVALLLFARAAARETEILVRSALGASRRRIVGQLFAEALVLSGVAAVVGLLAAQLALSRWGRPYLEANYDRLPFWYNFNLSPTTIMYALALAVIGALVAGVMPARKITRGLGTQLRAGTTGGGVSFGGIWTAVIVVQVTLTVMFPAVVMLLRSESNRIASKDAGFPMQEYLGVKVAIDAPSETMTPETVAALAARLSASMETLRQRLEAEPAVAGVTLATALPQDYHAERRIGVEAMPDSALFWVSTARIDPSYFTVLKAPMIAGRAFTSGDLSPDARVVIVDQGFVDLVMPGRSVIGHRVRVSSTTQVDSNWTQLPWYEIVGVVKELGMGTALERSRTAGVYLPNVPGSRTTMNMIVRGRSDPLAIGPRVRDLAAAVDPALRIEQITRLDQLKTPLLWFLGLWQKIIMGMTAVTLLLSLSGIYAVLSYIVARRTREVGVRVALGASARRIIISLFRRPMTHVSLGVIAGSVLIAVAAIGVQHTEEFAGIQPRGLTVEEIALLVGYAILMLGVCTLACVVPTLRALRVQPTEALRAE